jgi:acyl-CoA thioester hydrolase
MGVVYHGNYAQFFELGRTEWLRKLNITYKDMENNGIMLPVISLTCIFIKSAIYDDVLTIKLYTKTLFHQTNNPAFHITKSTI